MSDLGVPSYPASPIHPAQLGSSGSYSTSEGKDAVGPPAHSQSLDRVYPPLPAAAGRQNSLGRKQPTHAPMAADAALNGPRPQPMKDYRLVSMQLSLTHLLRCPPAGTTH